jgi:hypothetical protein
MIYFDQLAKTFSVMRFQNEMKRYPRVIDIEEAMRQARENMTLIRTQGGRDRWVPCRAYTITSLRERIRMAWMVFTGKADALIYPDQQ